jgi:hypothetical protein
MNSMAKSFLDLKQDSGKSLEKISEQLAKVIAPTFAMMMIDFGLQR